MKRKVNMYLETYLSETNDFENLLIRYRIDTRQSREE